MHIPIEGHRIKCKFCEKFFIVCSTCYRGQEYCGDECRSRSRRRNNRASSRAYQKTHRGKKNHAARQQSYRSKLSHLKKVTHQSSASNTTSLKSSRGNYLEYKNPQNSNSGQCIKCCVTVKAFLLPKLQSQRRRKTVWSTTPRWSPK